MILETERLVIRSFSREDVADYFKIVSDARVTRFLGDGATHDYLTAKAYVLNCVQLEAADELTRYAVDFRQTGQLIGFCGYKQLCGLTDFGFRFAHEFWGQGMATEAGRCVLEFGRNELGLHDITTRVERENAASTAVLRKLGFTAWVGPPGAEKRYLWFRMTV